jgi:hypothetical protein
MVAKSIQQTETLKDYAVSKDENIKGINLGRCHGGRV